MLSKYFERRQEQRSILRQAEHSSFSHDFGPGGPPRRFERQGSLPAIFHNNIRRMSTAFATDSNSINRRARFQSDAHRTLPGVSGRKTKYHIMVANSIWDI